MIMDVEFSTGETNMDVGLNEGDQAFGVDFGEFADTQGGQGGATFYPSVSDSGVISWTNDKGLPNPSPVNIKGPQGERGMQGERGAQGPTGAQGAKGDKGDRGEKGESGSDGKDGVSSTHRWNGTTLVVTSASGTSSADLKGDKGEKGDKGPQGEPGKTPVKGVDYFTDTDKTELVAAVISALPVYNGEVADV